MTTQTVSTPSTVDRVRGMMTRHNLNQPQMGRLLGVPHGTLGNWLTGTRTPNQVAARLVGVLEQAELFHRTFFLSLLAEAREGK